MRHFHAIPSLIVLGAAGLACAQEPQVLGDLATKQPTRLSREELQQLVTGARMSRVTTRGSTHFWTNDADGTFTISSDGRGYAGSLNRSGSTAPGKWHVSADGRYCVLIEWKSVEAEQWCRYLIKTTDGYFAVKSDSVPTERVHKLEISGK